MWLSGLMANSEVVSGAQEAVGAWEALAAVWRKFSLSAKERPSLPQCATVIQVGCHDRWTEIPLQMEVGPE